MSCFSTSTLYVVDWYKFFEVMKCHWIITHLLNQRTIYNKKISLFYEMPRSTEVQDSKSTWKVFIGMRFPFLSFVYLYFAFHIWRLKNPVYFVAIRGLSLPLGPWDNLVKTLYLWIHHIYTSVSMYAIREVYLKRIIL